MVPSYSDPVVTPNLAGDLLLGGAIAGYGLASGLYLSSRSELDAAAGASRYDEMARHVDSRGMERSGAWITGAAASGFVVKTAILR